MDALRPIEIATAAPVPTIAPGPAMPPEKPLAMPVQALSHWSRAEERAPAASDPYRAPWLARLFVFAGAAALTAYGAYEMYQVVSVSRTTVLQWLLLFLFTVNFSWIALAFTSGLLGFVSLLRGPRRLPPLPETLRSRTAVVMPVYNELTARTFAALEAMREEIEATGLGEHFDYFVLSDSTDPDAWIAEERAFLAWRQELGADARVYYRHRPKNHHRKAGNIADFVTRWGGAYDHMLVLDADSLMTGECIARLALAMEEDPDAGIIQTLPLIINRNTLFARAQQFAAKVYGPVVAAGLSVWSGRDGNYWGHNAIIRTRAFAAHCGLPDLPGRPPLGGHVLSHDFVEAALMRRAGYTVYMLHDLPGSYEESPPSLIDVATRDRRWCQGNLQHGRIIGARGLKLATRQHFATGIMSYLASPFWLFQLIVGIALVLQTTYIRPEYFSREFTLFPQWPRFDPERALALFGITMAVLLAPKFFGLVLMLLNAEGRRRAGGAVRLVASTVIEILLIGAHGADPHGDPVGLGVPDPARARHRLGAAAPRRRLDPAARHHPPPPLAYGARAPRRRLGFHDRDLAVSVDVADDHRPHPRDPAVLAFGPPRRRPRPEAPRPAHDPRGDADAGRRPARQRAPRREPAARL